MHADHYETLQDCRTLYLRHLGALLQDSGLLSPGAILAIQAGAGAYYDEVVSTQRRGSFAEEADGLTSSRLTLVGEDDLELGIRLDNLSARLFDTTGSALWKIHLRFVTLLRRPELPKSDNPVGPKSIAAGLNAMFAAAGAIALEQKLELLGRVEECLVRNLPGLYAEIDAQLNRSGVETAQPSIVSGQDGATPKTSGKPPANVLAALQQAVQSRLPLAAETLPGASGSAASSLLTQAMLEQLHFRLDNLERQGAHAGGPAATNEALIPELFATQWNAAGPRPLRSAELGVPPHARESLAIDTLGLICEAIFADPELPDALKAAISSLQITLLRVAMKDETLFSDPGHPARQVIDRMREAVLGLPVDTPSRHPACAALFEVAAQLRSAGAPDFPAAIARLDAVIAEHNQELADAARIYLPLLHQLDRRDAAAIDVRHALDALIAQSPPAVVRKFLETTWRHVMLQAWFEHGLDSPAWHGHLAAIAQLLGTFRPKTDPEARKALARELPGLLQKLKASMAQAGIPDAAQEAFLDDCFTLQTQALRGATAPQPAPGQAADIAPTGLHTEDNRPGNGTMQADNLTLETLDFPEFRPPPATPPACAVGDWLTFRLDTARTPVARLCHVSPESQRALLFNPDIGLAVAVHPAILASQLREGSAAVLNGQSLFEAAATRALHGTAGG